MLIMSNLATALLIIDLQRAFFEEPALAEHRARLLNSINALTDTAREADVPMFLISTEHSRDRSTWTLNMLDDDRGFLFHGDESTEVVEELNTDAMTRIEKTRDSAWVGTDLYMRLNNLRVDSIAVAGVSTHGCIAQTVRDAYAHNIRSTLVTDAVADAREDFHSATIEQLTAGRITALATSKELRSAWANAGPPIL